LVPPAPPLDADEAEPAAPPVTRRALIGGVALMAAMLLLAGLAVLPAPYAVRSPGPTEDTLGQANGAPLISITGAPVYQATGQLRLTTVSVAGGPGFPVNLVQVLQGWLDKTRSVQPAEEIFPPHQTQEETQQQGQAEMITSQENATVAALTALGYAVPAILTVAGTSSGSGAAGVVQEKDVITGINGVQVASYQELIDELAKVKPGATVDLTVNRAGASTTLHVVTTDRDGKAVLGVFIDPAFDFPVDVQIKIDDIGGPSAGTMFALGIMDLLTPDDEANGQNIAGTGTISVEGNVGAIGGIEQKMAGAKRDGATWFLAPADNCAEAAQAIPSGLNVVRITTLQDAWSAVKAIGAGTGKTLPTCS
jgi:PDZ domain-containing protein